MTFAAGQIVDEADLNAVTAASSEKPIGRLVQTVAQSLADNTQTAVTFTTEDIDTHSFHSTVTNTSRVTPTIAGWYRVHGTGFPASQTTPVTQDANIRKNGATNLAPAARQAGSQSAFSNTCTALVSCDGLSDYFELVLRQDSSGAVNTAVGSQISSVLEWEYVRGL